MIDKKNKQLIFWLLQLVIWTIYFLYNVHIVHGLAMPDNREVVFFYAFLYAYFGLPLSLMLRAAFNWLKRKSISNWVFALSVFGITLLAANIWAAEVYMLDRLFEDEDTPMSPVNLRFYIWEVFGDFLVLLAWSAFYLLIKLWYEWQTAKESAERAMLLAQSSQLQMLRNQINPHFLFNTLSSLRALVRIDQKKAEEMISKISDFLRYSLVNKKDTEVTLKEELDAINNYFEIERVRYEENLITRFDIDPIAEDYPVPSFLLHSIIENAVKYGMDTSDLPLEIDVKATVNNNTLMIEIMNTGKWIEQSDDTNGTGTGIRNVKERLDFLYPDGYDFKIKKENEKVSVILELTNKV
jgi:two-component system LytT family sensor kinase